MPDVFTVIVDVVAPVFHDNIPVHPLAVNVVDSPSQQMVLSVLITGDAGGVFLLIITGTLLLLVPQIFVQVTV